MKEFLEIIGRAQLFSGVSGSEAEAMLGCLGAREEAFEKGAFILREGVSTDSVGLLLTGSALIIQEDFWGNRNILASIAPGELFAEAFACSPGAVLSINVLAQEGCRVLWLDINRILTACPSACSYHSRMIRNLLSGLAGKNLRLNDRMTHMGQRTTREKLLSYLSGQSNRQGLREFDIVFNRQQLADHLSVDRSAMSAELSRLRDEGVIEFNRNHFVLKQPL